MRYDDDKTVKQKMDALDTLTGGIVYGREDAWERLQQRMDKKPVKRRAAWYGIAASVLLLIGIVSFWQHTPGKTDVASEHIAVQKTTDNSTIATALPATNNTVADTNEVAGIAPHLATVVPGPSTNNSRLAHRDSVLPVIVNNDTVVSKPVVAVVAAPVIKQPMRVLHINDLDGEGTLQQPAKSVTAQAINNRSIAKITVVHLNDLVREVPQQVQEEHSIKYVATNRPLLIGTNYMAHTSLRIKINTQN